jgi:hypothetical protein
VLPLSVVPDYVVLNQLNLSIGLSGSITAVGKGWRGGKADGAGGWTSR